MLMSSNLIVFYLADPDFTQWAVVEMNVWMGGWMDGWMDEL